MEKFRKLMEILSNNPGPGLMIFGIIFWILLMLFIPAKSHGAPNDDAVNKWLLKLPESVAKLEVMSVRRHKIYKAIGYTT